MNRKQLDALCRELRSIRKGLGEHEQGTFLKCFSAIANVLMVYNSNFNLERFRDEVFK